MQRAVLSNSSKINENANNILVGGRQYIEDIQFFLLNMAFISSSEVENIYI